ncbi:MAG TPA: diacylglycerol kinase family protein [Propionibacteriaceae bacterium]|nr:diacylglycerol kinase family protein [Propionibacteriaceae bacterium]
MDSSESSRGSESARLAVVINPSKFDDVEAVKSEIQGYLEAGGWSAAAWYETTEEDPGEGQARQALDEGATIVASLGGDGTVRAVASVLAGTDIPLALLPGGTGNLLARNLDVPYDDLQLAVEAMISGVDRRIDTGIVRFSSHTGASTENRFLVMAGMGIDADAMANTNESLKARIGWPAYAITGLKELVKAGFRVCVDTPHEISLIQYARSVLIGNCGTLTGGIRLMPEASLDDGVLDGLVVSPYGLVGWTALVGDFVTRSRHGHRLLARRRASEFVVRLSDPNLGEIDGDPVGRFERMEVRCDPQSLTVRVPAQLEEKETGDE